MKFFFCYWTFKYTFCFDLTFPQCYFFIFIVLIKIFSFSPKLHFQSTSGKQEGKKKYLKSKLNGKEKFFKLICHNLGLKQTRERKRGEKWGKKRLKRKSKCQEANHWNYSSSNSIIVNNADKLRRAQYEGRWFLATFFWESKKQ